MSDEPRRYGGYTLDELDALDKAATPGPWEHHNDDDWHRQVEAPDSSVICEVSVDLLSGDVNANGEFIAAAREAMPPLVARVRLLAARVAGLDMELCGFCGHPRHAHNSYTDHDECNMCYPSSEDCCSCFETTT